MVNYSKNESINTCVQIFSNKLVLQVTLANATVANNTNLSISI